MIKLLTKYHMRGHFGSVNCRGILRLTRFLATCRSTQTTYTHHHHATGILFIAASTAEVCVVKVSPYLHLASSGQKPQFWANFDFWGLLYRLPFTDKRQIWCPEADRTTTLTCQISSESVHCVGFRWPKKTQFWANV